MVSSAVSSRALAGSLGSLSAATTHGAETHRPAKRIEEPFGWIKTIAGGRQLRDRGRERNRAWFKITAAVYNGNRRARRRAAATDHHRPVSAPCSRPEFRGGGVSHRIVVFGTA
jgi:hypothetical protein